MKIKFLGDIGELKAGIETVLPLIGLELSEIKLERELIECFFPLTKEFSL